MVKTSTTPNYKKLIDQAFTLLLCQHGLTDVTYEGESEFTEATFESAIVAIQVYIEPRDFYVTVSMTRPQGKRVAEYNWSDRISHPLDHFGLDDLIRLRGGTPPAQPKELTTDALKRVLQEYSASLSEYASDVLSGDFSVFNDLTRIVVARIKTFIATGATLGPDTLAVLEAAQRLGFD